MIVKLIKITLRSFKVDWIDFKVDPPPLSTYYVCKNIINAKFDYNFIIPLTREHNQSIKPSCPTKSWIRSSSFKVNLLNRDACVSRWRHPLPRLALAWGDLRHVVCTLANVIPCETWPTWHKRSYLLLIHVFGFAGTGRGWYQTTINHFSSVLFCIYCRFFFSISISMYLKIKLRLFYLVHLQLMFWII